MIAHLDGQMEDVLCMDTGDTASELRRELPKLRVVRDTSFGDATRQITCEQLAEAEDDVARRSPIVMQSQDAVGARASTILVFRCSHHHAAPHRLLEQTASEQQPVRVRRRSLDHRSHQRRLRRTPLQDEWLQSLV